MRIKNAEKVKWTAKKLKIVKASNKSITFTANSAGKYTITAKAKRNNDSWRKYSCRVTAVKPTSAKKPPAIYTGSGVDTYNTAAPTQSPEIWTGSGTDAYNTPAPTRSPEIWIGSGAEAYNTPAPTRSPEVWIGSGTDVYNTEHPTLIDPEPAIETEIPTIIDPEPAIETEIPTIIDPEPAIETENPNDFNPVELKVTKASESTRIPLYVTLSDKKTYQIRENKSALNDGTYLYSDYSFITDARSQNVMPVRLTDFATKGTVGKLGANLMLRVPSYNTNTHKTNGYAFIKLTGNEFNGTPVYTLENRYISYAATSISRTNAIRSNGTVTENAYVLNVKSEAVDREYEEYTGAKYQTLQFDITKYINNPGSTNERIKATNTTNSIALSTFKSKLSEKNYNLKTTADKKYLLYITDTDYVDVTNDLVSATYPKADNTYGYVAQYRFSGYSATANSGVLKLTLDNGEVLTAHVSKEVKITETPKTEKDAFSYNLVYIDDAFYNQSSLSAYKTTYDIFSLDERATTNLAFYHDDYIRSDQLLGLMVKTDIDGRYYIGNTSRAKNTPVDTVFTVARASSSDRITPAVQLSNGTTYQLNDVQREYNNVTHLYDFTFQDDVNNKKVTIEYSEFTHAKVAAYEDALYLRTDSTYGSDEHSYIRLTKNEYDDEVSDALFELQTRYVSYTIKSIDYAPILLEDGSFLKNGIYMTVESEALDEVAAKSLEAKTVTRRYDITSRVADTKGIKSLIFTTEDGLQTNSVPLNSLIGSKVTTTAEKNGDKTTFKHTIKNGKYHFDLGKEVKGVYNDQSDLAGFTAYVKAADTVRVKKSDYLKLTLSDNSEYYVLLYGNPTLGGSISDGAVDAYDKLPYNLVLDPGLKEYIKTHNDNTEITWTVCRHSLDGSSSEADTVLTNKTIIGMPVVKVNSKPCLYIGGEHTYLPLFTESQI